MFYNCVALTSVDISFSSVTSIGYNVFYNCTALPNITIPFNVTSIGGGAFNNCTSLPNITIPPNVTSIGGGAFARCSLFTNINIPNSVSNIGASCFESCTGLTSISIPNSVSNIGAAAFKFCTSLKSVSIPNQVTNLNYRTFRDCIKLTSVIIPDSVTSIGEEVFTNCQILPKIDLSLNIVNIGTNSFNGCLAFTSISIPNSVTNIGDGAFNQCVNLQSIIIPPLITRINSYMFYNCSALTSISIPSGITYIGDGICYNCVSLPSFNIPEGVTSIGGYVCFNCTSLTSITIPSSVASVGDNSFYNCTSLINITINAYLQNIPSVFPNINNSNMTWNLTYDGDIPNELLKGKNNITNLTIGDRIKIIGDMAFSQCTGLTNVTIPPYVLGIGADIFSDCSSALVVTFKPKKTNLPPDTSWILFTILFNGNLVLDGFFAVVDETGFIKLMYSSKNTSNNILAPYTNNDLGNDRYWDSNTNTLGGSANITSIPALDVSYNATEWQLYNSGLSYKDTSGNWIDLPQGSVLYTFTKAAAYPICFPAGTPVLTDQGEIEIDQINVKTNTIQGKKIVAVTKTITDENEIICIEKDAINANVPCRQTIISSNHKLLFNNKMTKAKDIVGKVNGVYNVKYNNELLYNVLLETHDTMIVNNLVVETLNPKHIVCKKFNPNYKKTN